MCLIALAWQAHARYPLILVANRDEYYARPTAKAQFWEENPNLLGGRDLQAGGTWLGVRCDGRWSAVTNYREGEAASAPRSRGELTSRFLQYPGELDDYAQQCLAQGAEYGGFNLLLGDRQRLLYCSNRQRQAKELEAGIYSLSNHLLDTPWPKAVHAREALEEVIAVADPDPQQLLSALQRDEPYGDELLPDTGVGIELERLLSPPLIHSEHYGTRCTTVLIQDREGETTLLEQSYLQGGRKGELRRFSIPPQGQ